MQKNSQEPGKFDAVKGRQVPPPVSGAVLGGIEGLRQRFATGNEQIRLDAVANASIYGDEALDILVKALKDTSLQVRVKAYKILKESNQAESETAKGILLRVGDISYKVYISAIDYDDDYYTILDSMQAIQEHRFEYDESPSFIKTFFLKEDAEIFANEIHMKILEGENLTDANWKNFLKSKAAFLLSHSDLSGFYRNFELQITDWCKMHKINLLSEIDEDDFEFQEKVIQYLGQSGQYQLLDELRELLGIRKFAFVHEETILEDSYLKIKDNI